MSMLTAVVWSLHVGFAVLWTGSVLFVALAVVPLATREGIAGAALSAIVDRLTWITRIAALAFLASGGYMAQTLYTAESLTGTGRGHLVLAMLTLWVFTTGLIEAGSGRLTDELTTARVDAAAHSVRGFFYGAAALSVGLILTAGALITPSV